MVSGTEILAVYPYLFKDLERHGIWNGHLPGNDTGIDPSLYEAAVMDGATKWQQTKHITMPCIKPVLIMMLILDAGKIFYSDFGLFYQATGGIPASLYNVASTFDTYIYKAIQSSAPIGKTAAASFFQSYAVVQLFCLQTGW